MGKVLALFIDALRHDFQELKATPFLSNLASNDSISNLRPTLAYSDGIRATLFTGTYPDIHDYWMMFHFNPQTSPFRMYKSLRFLDYLPSLLERGSKFMASTFLGYPVAKMKGLPNLFTHNLPYSVIHYFDKSLGFNILEKDALKVPTLFDNLRKKSMKFMYIDSSKVNVLQAIKKIEWDVDLVVVYLFYLDYAAHRFGLDDPNYWETLRKTDRLCKVLTAWGKERMGAQTNVLVFSDHGMTQPKQYVNLSWLIKNSKHGKDYLLFLDSTMVHVWYLNPEKKDEIRRTIQKLPWGHILSNKEKKDLRLNFEHNLYGEDIYLLDPDFQIFPNYHSLMKPKGMHAYHPDYEHQRGVFISENRCNAGNLVELPDVTATLYALLDLKSPKTCEGRSLV